MQMGSVGRWRLVSIQRGSHPSSPAIGWGPGGQCHQVSWPLKRPRFLWALSSIGQFF